MVVAQLARASDCGSEGRRFEPGLPPHDDWECDIMLAALFFHFLCDFTSLELSFLNIFLFESLYFLIFSFEIFPLGGLPETDCLFLDLILSSCLCLFI